MGHASWVVCALLAQWDMLAGLFVKGWDWCRRGNVAGVGLVLSSYQSYRNEVDMG